MQYMNPAGLLRERVGERAGAVLLRPAICNERLQRLESGEVLLTLRRRWSDGTFAKVFQPQDLISKIIALLPAPGANLLRFHGQFAPGARWRAHVTAGAGRVRKATAPPKGDEQRHRRMAWSVLLRRSFAIEALICPACGGRRELLAVIEHKPTVQKILAHLGLPTEPPAFALPRGPPLLAGLDAPDTVGVPKGARDAGRRVVVDPGFVEPVYD